MHTTNYHDFRTLFINNQPAWQALFCQLKSHLDTLDGNWLTTQHRLWRHINQPNSTEKAQTDWLIAIFNACFVDTHTCLVRGGDEPEYLPACDNKSAQIIFAHGYFASGLHEISHWCIAGKHRRTLPDFGYWYTPDGRNQATQRHFEQVEIKPQAIECLFTLATGRFFYVSADNLNADFDTSDSTFAHDVYQQALSYLRTPTNLPKDAQKFLVLLLRLCQDDYQ